MFSKREEDALKTIFEKIPEMSDFQRGRFLGMAEMLEEQNRKKKDEEKIFSQAG